MKHKLIFEKYPWCPASVLPFSQFPSSFSPCYQRPLSERLFNKLQSKPRLKLGFGLNRFKPLKWIPFCRLYMSPGTEVWEDENETDKSVKARRSCDGVRPSWKEATALPAGLACFIEIILAWPTAQTCKLPSFTGPPAIAGGFYWPKWATHPLTPCHVLALFCIFH